ncbi:MAG TPA: MalY/PatB family protein [Bacillaceae bacterium]
MNKFDQKVDRRHTASVKWDGQKALFGYDDLLPMWVADMDFKPPEEVLHAMERRLEHGIFGYTMTGESTASAIMEWLHSRHCWDIKPEWLLYHHGVVPSIGAAIQAFTDPGDKVLLQTPVYTPFFQMIEKNSRTVIHTRLLLENGRYSIDFQDFEEKLKDGAKLFLLCNPHNPGGRVWTKDELMKMAELCKKYGVLIVSDEIHADLVLKPNRHIPLAALDSSYAGMTLTFMAPSKTFNLAGLQASYMIIPNAELRNRMAEVQQKDGFITLNTFGIVAMEAAYRHGSKWLEELLDYIQGNIKLVKEEIETSLPMLRVMDPEGTYLVWIDCRNTGLTDNEIRQRLLTKGKLALNDGEPYGPGGEGFVRMNVACPREMVAEGIKRLKAAFLDA